MEILLAMQRSVLSRRLGSCLGNSLRATARWPFFMAHSHREVALFYMLQPPKGGLF